MRTPSVSMPAVRGSTQSRTFVGPIVGITATHIEQQVSAEKIVRHERSRFKPDPANGALRDAVKPGLAAPLAIVTYDREQAVLRPVRLDAEVRARLQQQLSQWADQAFTDPALRDRFKESASRAVDGLGSQRSADDPRAFARHLAYESASGSSRESPLDRILQRHEAAGLQGPSGTHSVRTQALGAAGMRLWAQLDAADVARLYSDRTSEQDRQAALAVIRRAPEEYRQAFARALRDVEPTHERQAATGPQSRSLGNPGLQRDRGQER